MMLANVGAIREDAPMDFERLGLLRGLEGEARDKRRRLLERLAADGFSERQLVTAVNENRLALLPVERVLGGTYTAAEVEERAGLPAGTMARIRRQHGLPGARGRRPRLHRRGRRGGQVDEALPRRRFCRRARG